MLILYTQRYLVGSGKEGHQGGFRLSLLFEGVWFSQAYCPRSL